LGGVLLYWYSRRLRCWQYDCPTKPNGGSKKGAIRHEGLDGRYPSLKASHLATLAPSCKSACKRRAWGEVRAGMKLGEATRRGLPETRRRGNSHTLATLRHDKPRPRWGALHWLPQRFCSRRPGTGHRPPFRIRESRWRLDPVFTKPGFRKRRDFLGVFGTWAKGGSLQNEVSFGKGHFAMGPKRDPNPRTVGRKLLERHAFIA
jgi:hypothetical protein